MSRELQDSLLESIKLIAGEKLKNVNFTKSYTGIVRTVDYDNHKCMVEIFGHAYECVLPHNLSNYVDLEDIVIIQDIFNNKFRRIIHGVISSLRKDMFHIYDPIEDRIVSSILQLWDEETQQPINVQFELE